MIVVNQSIGDLTNDILIDFANNNEQVIVFTGVSVEFLVPSKNVKYFYGSKYNKKNYFTRLISWLLFTLQTFIFLLKNKKEDEEIFLISNPPFLFFLVLFFKKNPFYLLVYDLYPDILKIKIKHDFFGIIKIWSVLNKHIFNKAKLVFTIGENMKLALANYCDIDKIVVISNWSRSYKSGLNHKESFDEKYSFLTNKFTFIYSGNMGVTHDFESVKSLMLHFKNDRNVIFLFISSGSKFNEMKDYVINNSINNCFFFNKLPIDEFNYVLYKASIGIITLDKSMESYSVPSKTFSYISHGLPILNFSTPISEITNLVTNFDIGINFDVNNFSISLQLVKDLIADKGALEKLKLQSYDISEKHFSPENSTHYLRYIQKFRSQILP